MKRYGAIVIALLCASGDAQGFSLERGLLGPGGGRATGGAFNLEGSIAQTVAGRSTGGAFVLDAGFWSLTTQAPGGDDLFQDGFE